MTIILPENQRRARNEGENVTKFSYPAPENAYPGAGFAIIHPPAAHMRADKQDANNDRPIKDDSVGNGLLPMDED